MPTRRRFFASALAGWALMAKPSFALHVREYHVSVHGNDANDGSKSSMLRTIAAAAAKAYPGDTITVHQGIYRERVDPPRGGLSDTRRITYQAAIGRARRDLRSGGGQRMVESTGWRLEGSVAKHILWQLQSLQRCDPWRLVLPQECASSTRVPFTLTATG